MAPFSTGQWAQRSARTHQQTTRAELRMNTKRRLTRRHTTMAVLLAAVALTGSACVSENAPPTGTIEFTNGTEVRVSMMLGRTEGGLQELLDQVGYLTSAHEPGDTWTHGNVGVITEEYCQDDSTYWFVTPKDQTFIADGRADADRLWTAGDVIVVDQIDGPCWDKNDSYIITDQR